jgi:Fur family peroxide stress response transcriptional regulator
VKEIVDVFKQKGIRATPQRLEVYKVLQNQSGHLPVEAIYEKIKDKLPGLSLATVYSILELFRDKKLAGEVWIKSDKVCFESRPDIHHHFYCRACGKISDLDIPGCAALTSKEVAGNLIEDLQGYFYGVCFKCRSGKK